MPYKITKKDGKHCVVKESGASVPGGCHADASKASAHMRALYAAEGREKKELTEDQEELIVKELEEKDYSYIDSVVPGGVTSFKDLAAWRETQKETEEIRNTSGDFQQLVSNILWNFEVKDKAGAIKTLADEFSGLLAEDIADVKNPDSDSEDKAFRTKVKEWFINMFVTKQEQDKPESGPNGLMLWKETDGSWRWFARYSNKFRDRDNPPEIISSKSHISFVEKVDKGIAPYPELWLWHRPEWKWGKAHWVGYDDAGFALAMGSVDKGYEPLAEAMSKLDQKSIRVSHGMPKKSIVRDLDDPTVIVEHETVEISPLPARAAANMLTSFIILNKEDNMAIPANKREELIKDWGLTAEQLDSLEKQNEAQAKEATEKGIQSKEVAPQAAPQAPETPATEVPPTSAPAAPVQKEADPTPPPATTLPSVEEIATAVSGALNERLTAIDQRFTVIETALAQANAEIKALKETDESKILKATEKVPSASYAALLQSAVRSAIGADETLVDGRTGLAKSKPKETAAPQERPGHPAMWIVDDIVKGLDKPASQ